MSKITHDFSQNPDEEKVLISKDFAFHLLEVYELSLRPIPVDVIMADFVAHLQTVSQYDHFMQAIHNFTTSRKLIESIKKKELDKYRIHESSY